MTNSGENAALRSICTRSRFRFTRSASGQDRPAYPRQYRRLLSRGRSEKAQNIGGWIADQAGPRRTLAGSVAGWSIWVLLTPLAPTVLWLTAAFRILLGAFEAPYIPASVAAVARAIPSGTRGGRFDAFMQSGAQLGPAAGVFFAGLILQATGSPTYIFIVFGVVGLAGAAAWWFYAKNFSDPRPQGAQAETSEAKERAAQAPVPHRLLITSPALWPFYIGYFALPYCQYIFLTWLPQYLTHYRNIPLVTASVLSALPFLVSFIGANFAGWAMDWLAEKGSTKGEFHRKFFVALGAATYAVNHTDCRDNLVNHGRGDNDRYRQRELGILCRAVLDDLHRCRAESDRHPWRHQNFFGIIGATASPYLSGVIAQETGAFVAPLLLAVAIMLTAATTMILLFRISPLTSLVSETPGAARFAA